MKCRIWMKKWGWGGWTMIAPWLKEAKIVMFRETFKQAPIPQSSNFGEKAVWLELPPYKLNTEENESDCKMMSAL